MILCYYVPAFFLLSLILHLRQEVEETITEDNSSGFRGRLSFLDQDRTTSANNSQLMKRLSGSHLRKTETSMDSNDTEFDRYEEVVNELAEQLEKMNAEKNDLQAISTALGERLQRLNKEKDESLRSIAAAHQKETQDLEEKIADLEKQLREKVWSLLVFFSF